MKRLLVSAALVASAFASASCDEEPALELGPAHPPDPPPGPPGDASGPVVIAITRLSFGTEKLSDGLASTDAWREYGFDLDGLVTTTSFNNHCGPNSSANPNASFPDGYDGRDNAWGKKILPLVRSMHGGTDVETPWNRPIWDGLQTLLIDLPNLGTGANYAPLDARALTGVNRSSDGAWQLASRYRVGHAGEPRAMEFESAYLVHDTFVGRAPLIELDIADYLVPLHLRIHHAIVAMELSPDHKTATNGTIAGILATEELIGTLQSAVGQFAPDLCAGSAIDSVLTQWRQASDIGVGGTQDPTKTCDGISIGLAFEGAATEVGPVVGPILHPDHCPN